MKTRLTLLIILFSSFLYLGSSAQSYYYLQTQGTEAAYNYQTLGDTFNGWASGMHDTLVKTKSLPFSWKFYGETVTSFRVSDNGYVTFDASATKSDPNNVTLPSASAPLKAIFAFWDNLVLYKPNTYSYLIHTWTYGAAPNRVFVIAWFQASKEPAGTTDSRYTFGIRLYESGSKNFDIVYDNYYNTGTAATTTGSAGCQNGDGTAGTMISGSPNITFPTNITTTQTDDVVYEFYYGTQPGYDLTALSLNVNNPVKVSTANQIGGVIRNFGSQTVTSFDLYYSVNGVKSQKTTINQTLAPGASITATSTEDWTPDSVGVYDIKLWAENINGSNADENTGNDAAAIQVLVNNGIYGIKNVLLEEGTGTWCGWCPDGAILLGNILHAKLAEGKWLIGIANHNSNGSVEPMAFPAGEVMNSSFSSGFPYGTVDRYKFPDYSTVGFTRSDWAKRVDERFAVTTPVNVSVSNVNYNTTSRQLTFDVNMNFVDCTYGDLKVSAILVENWVGGSGGTWNQGNYIHLYPGYESNPLYNMPAILNNTSAGGNWFHHHVSRKYVSATWGDNIDATSGPHLVNAGNLTKSYSTTLTSTWNPNNMQIVAFVSYYNNDITKRDILNVTEAKITSVSVNEITNTNDVSEIYPNPVSDDAYINFSIENTTSVSLDIFDIMGKKVMSKEQTKYASGSNNLYFNASELPEGTYIAVLKIGDTSYSRKFIK